MSALIVDREKLIIAPTQSAIAARDAALECSALIARVDNQEQRDAAVEAQRGLKAIMVETEKARVEVKAPFLDLCKRIDNAAKTHVQECAADELRLARLIGDYEAVQLAKQRAAEAARKLEMERIQQEEARRLRELAMAEAAKQRELLAKEEAARKVNDEALAREIEAQRKLSEAKTIDEMDQIQHERNQAQLALPVADVSRADNQRVQEEWEWEVTNIWEFATAHPGAVKIEVRAKELKGILDKVGSAPGIRAKKVVVSRVRV